MRDRAPAFWGFSLLGSILVASFALAGNTGMSISGDLLMLAAVVVCGLGYAEGARLTRELGGLAVICWALLLSLPLMLIACGLTIPVSFRGISASAWTALAYVSLFSMMIGFYLLVSGTGNRRYCGGRSTPAIAAPFFRPRHWRHYSFMNQ